MSAGRHWRAWTLDAPWTRMQLDLVLAEAEASSAELYRFSMLAGLSFRSSEGWLYWRPEPLRDRVAVEERVGRIVQDHHVGHVDRVVARTAGALASAPPGGPARLALADLDDRALARQVCAAAQDHRRLLRWQFTASGACGLSVGMLGTFVREQLRDGARRTVVDLLAAGPPVPGTASGSLLAPGTGADRSIGSRIEEPSLADRPDLARRAARGCSHADTGPDPAGAFAHALAGVRNRAVFGEVLARARRSFLTTEAALDRTRCSGARVRRAVLEVGRRLESRGGLESGADVLHLRLAEALAALEAPDAGGPVLRRRAAGRRTRFQGLCAAGLPAPADEGEDVLESAAPTWLDSLPREVARCVDAVHWSRRVLGGGAGPPGTAPVRAFPGAAGPADLTGHGVGGRMTGRVRLVDGAEALAEPGSDEVLVCRGDDVDALALLAAPGALVTESPGVLGRTEVLALRRGFPAVVGVRDATTRLRSGDRVTVDGRTGLIEEQR